MIGMILAAAAVVGPLAPPDTPMWIMNFNVDGPAHPCKRTYQGYAIQGLKAFAKKSPKVKFGYQWLNDNGELVLRSTIQGPGKPMDAVFFTYSESFCLDKWSTYYKNPLWGHDERYVTGVTAKGIIVARLKWTGAPSPDAP